MPSGSKAQKHQKGSLFIILNLTSAHILGLLQITLSRILEAKSEKLVNDKKGVRSGGNTSLIRHIVNSDMPESERADHRLVNEAEVLLGAGTTTVARTIGYISYFILANPSLRTRLEEELQEPMYRYPEVVPTWTELEKVPILQALIKEGLR